MATQISINVNKNNFKGGDYSLPGFMCQRGGTACFSDKSRFSIESQCQ